MPSLKEYRNRITSVKSTRKITSAMKMVAASKLRRAQTQAEASQPYAARMAEMMARLIAKADMGADAPLLLRGTGRDDVHLLIVVTSDRGLCGGFNANIIKTARQTIGALLKAGKTVKVACVGRKGHDALRRSHPEYVVKSFTGLGRKGVGFAEAQQVSAFILEMLEEGAFDVCALLYNEFKSVIAQIPTQMQLVPFESGAVTADAESDTQGGAQYIFEPDEKTILEGLLPRNLSVQVYRTLLDSAAGEQAARMTAMDNATRNAGDMIKGLTLSYNRARQAYITKELIEIISGAEAV